MLYLFLIPTILIGVFSIFQLWTSVISEEIFVRLLITYCILMVVAVIVLATKKYFDEEKKNKDNNLIS